MQLFKKILALTLALTLTLSMGAVTVFAAETAMTQESLEALINSAEAGATISLTSGVELTEPLVITKNVTIDGNNFTIDGSKMTKAYTTASVKSKFHAIIVLDTDATLKNLTVSGTKGTGNDARGYGIHMGAAQGSSHKLTLENVEVKDTANGGGLLVNAAGTTVKITNSTFSNNAWGEIELVKGCTLDVDDATTFAPTEGKYAIWVDDATLSDMGTVRGGILDAYTPIAKDSNVYFVLKPTIAVTGLGADGAGTITKAAELYDESEIGLVTLKEGQELPADTSTVTLTANNYPESIKFKIIVTPPEGGSTDNIQIIAKDTLNNLYDVVTTEEWGPPSGFVPVDGASTTFSLIASAIGDYKIKVDTILPGGATELSSAEWILTVEEAGEELTAITPLATTHTFTADMADKDAALAAMAAWQGTVAVTTTKDTTSLPVVWTVKNDGIYTATAGATNTFVWTAELGDLLNTAEVELTGETVVTNKAEVVVAEKLSTITPLATTHTFTADMADKDAALAAMAAWQGTVAVTTTKDTTSLPVVWTVKDDGDYTATAGATNTFVWTATLDSIEANGKVTTGETVVTNKAAGVTVDYKGLELAITAAEAKTVGVLVSADGTDVAKDKKWVTAAANTAFTTAIATAKSALTATTQAAVDAAKTALVAATTAYAPQAGTKEPTVPGSDATLKNLSYVVDDGDKVSVPGFASTKTEYTVTLAPGFSSVIIWGNPTDSDAKTDASSSVANASNNNTAKLIVTSEDETETKTYTVTFRTNDPVVPPVVDDDDDDDNNSSTGGNSGGSNNVANKPETTEKVNDTIAALKDPTAALPAGVTKTTTAGGATISTIPVPMMSGSATVGMDMFNTLGSAPANVGLKFTVSAGLTGGSVEIIVPGGFGKITEPGRIGYSMDFSPKAENNDRMLKAVKGENVTSTTAKIGGNQTLPVAATITVATKVANGTTVNIYKYDPLTGKLIVIGKAVAKDGKLTFNTKIMGEMLFTTGTI